MGSGDVGQGGDGVGTGVGDVREGDALGPHRIAPAGFGHRAAGVGHGRDGAADALDVPQGWAWQAQRAIGTRQPARLDALRAMVGVAARRVHREGVGDLDHRRSEKEGGRPRG